MAKLADAIDLGSIVTDVGVQVPLVAPDKNKTNLFGFVFFILFSAVYRFRAVHALFQVKIATYVFSPETDFIISPSKYKRNV